MPSITVVNLSRARNRSFDSALSDGALKVLDRVRSGFRAPQFQNGRDVEACVPGVELGGTSEQPDRVPIGANALRTMSRKRRPVISQLSSGHFQTGGEPLHIPFEWADSGFVEVVDVEDQITLGRGKAAEVR